MDKTLHLKREYVKKNPTGYPQCLAYDLIGWTENDLQQLDDLLQHFKDGSNGEFDFYIGRYFDVEEQTSEDFFLKIDSPDGFYPAVDAERKKQQCYE